MHFKTKVYFKLDGLRWNDPDEICSKMFSTTKSLILQKNKTS